LVAARRVGLRMIWLKGDKGGSEMAGVFGSLVQGEQKPKDLGTAVSFPNKMRARGCDSFGFKRVSGGCKLVGARKGEFV
jgi:hypothetical protein